MHRRKVAILWGTILLCWTTSVFAASLKIDFTPTGGLVEDGWQGYFAVHESAATFTAQSYSAFGTTVAVTPVWTNNPAPEAKQMIRRASGSDLVADWIGTDGRVANANPLVLLISGLPAGVYFWTSYHHDPQDQTGLFDVTIADGQGIATTTGVDISNGSLSLDTVTTFRATIVSDGVLPIALSFRVQPFVDVSHAFFVMNAFTLENLETEKDPTIGEGPEVSSVVINEFVASNSRGLRDGDGNTSDWIELYNGLSHAVSLAGWRLTDDPRDLAKWSFPPGTQLVPHGYLVVFASGRPLQDSVDKAGCLHANFSLNKDGEYLALIDPSGAVVHEYAPQFPPQEADVSYGLWRGMPCYFSPPTPGKANERGFAGLLARTVHSHERGFYDEPFDLWIHCDTPNVVIRYTLDGSEPTEQHGLIYNPAIPIRIATTTHVRSAAFKTGWKPAGVTTHSYIFVDAVAVQGPKPPGWPDNWGYNSEVGGIVPADYEMDPRVVQNTLPGYSIRDALLDIPSISISMNPLDFISTASGIYANPQSRWERKCSVEYILPDGTPGFQNDCKIEIHGNSSRRPWRMQKHSLRLTFTGQYGPTKLRYPLFPASTVDKFNQLVLRAGFTDSWALVSWDPSRYRPNDSQYLRDAWMKETFRDMGQPSSYGSFVHLYVNGLYFGLYNLSERVAADFFADHLGGEPQDWEINNDFSTPGPRWNAMMAIDPSTPAGYAKMQEYLDVENFADYMLLHFYADAEDWPHHNGYAAVNARSGDGRFRFFVWDQEIVLDYHGRAASRIDNPNGAGSVFQKLRTSEEFRLLFADRVYKHCFNDGALSVAASQDRYRDLASWIDKAIVAESARWGDVQIKTPYGNAIQQPTPLTDVNHNMFPPVPHGPDYYFTREDSWVVERDNIVGNYLPAIHNTANSYALINVLRAAKLYPTIDPPIFHVNGIPQHGGQVSRGDVLTMTNPNARGTIYYTLDGSDPRAPGSAAQPAAENVLVPEEAAKRVLIPQSDIGHTWRSGEPFDDSGWISGSGGIGFERSTGYESLFKIDVSSRMYGVNATCYIRVPFLVAVENLRELAGLVLKVRYDDAFVAYLNGVEVARDLFTGIPQWNSSAMGSHSDSQAVSFVDFDISAHVGLLRPGVNLLALHAMNASATSSDFLISVKLVATADNSGNDVSVAASAVRYATPIRLDDTPHVKARILDNGQWSALNEATYNAK
ncbi:MAG TPA: CotH kinase family protein [Sedimentisphaerales bacterium]|nr:CotH kinase family protein [Sedimentisphaerales bacterium]